MSHNISSYPSTLNKWKNNEAKLLKQDFIKEINSIQNPTQISNQKKISCNMKPACGFGCQMHHLEYCLLTSFVTNRTMILNSKGWTYNKNGFEEYFQNISNTDLNHQNLNDTSDFFCKYY